MQLKGVNYDVGRVLMGQQQRPIFDTRLIHRELEIIHNDLHCNAVKIQGCEIARVMAAAEDALRQGLDVWIAPELFEHSQDETFAYTVEAAVAAERLRQSWPNLVLSVGTELMLFMQGILEGKTLMERLASPSLREQVLAGTSNQPLNAYLARTTEAVRRVFHGKITYAAVDRIEAVDWSLFDVVSVDLYRDAHNRTVYPTRVQHYLAHNKPVVVGEFGCCTYQGAEDAGGMGWSIVDWEQWPPRLKGDYVYDQGVQARELAEQLHILDAAGVEGAFVFTFVEPGPEVSDALAQVLRELSFDPDIASYSLVKSLVDRRGTTYPDMPWEPKEAFRAVAEYYAAH